MSTTKYIVNNLSGQTITNEPILRPYKVYTALLLQSGGGYPTTTLLDNNLEGVPYYLYAAPGHYTINLANAFTSAKTTILFGPGDSSGVIYGWEWNSSSQITIYSLDSAGNKTDNLLNNTTIEIRVYN